MYKTYELFGITFNVIEGGWSDEVIGEFVWEQNALAWLADPANRDHENYWDIFKEVYGIRPRW